MYTLCSQYFLCYRSLPGHAEDAEAAKTLSILNVAAIIKRISSNRIVFLFIYFPLA